MNVNSLMYALDNENNEGIIHLTSKKILEMNLNIIKELHLDKNTTLNYLKKLKGYRYVDEINDIKYGGFIRWIPITDPNYLPLHYCGMICDIKITDNGVIIKCKNYDAQNKNHFSLFRGKPRIVKFRFSESGKKFLFQQKKS